MIKLCLPVCLALWIVAAAGCVGTEGAGPPVPKIIHSEKGLPLSAGFVYQEKIHSAGKAFSVEEEFWENFFPRAATAFATAERFDSIEEAINAEVDVVVDCKNVVHGSKKSFSYSVLVTPRDLRTIQYGQKSFEEKLVTDEDIDQKLAAVGFRVANWLKRAKKIRALGK